MKKTILFSCIAELFGTFLLILLGCGSAIFSGDKIGILGVGLTFGLTLMALAATIGPISGCHVNPAVTLGLALSGKMPKKDIGRYLVSQIIGAALAGMVLYIIASGKTGFNLSQGFALTGFGEHSPSGYSPLSCFIVEAVLTAVLVYVVLGTTRPYSKGFQALTVGGTLAALIWVSAPITNASLNWARSFGVAIVHQGWALSQLGFFAIAHIVGVILAVGVAKLTLPESVSN